MSKNNLNPIPYDYISVVEVYKNFQCCQLD